MEWLAGELGLEPEKVHVTLLHASSESQGAVKNKASSGYKADIQLCELSAQLRDAAAILDDVEGTRLAALSEAINDLAPPEAPLTDETATSVVTAFEQAREGTQYAIAKEYVDAFAQYVTLLDATFASLVDDSQAFVFDKYGESMMENNNPNITAFVAWHMGVEVQ
jgi:hypothetical protein